jgi:hypothetical protein
MFRRLQRVSEWQGSGGVRQPDRPVP